MAGEGGRTTLYSGGDQLTSVVDVMSDPALYGESVTSVEVVETHISWVFLAGDHAYKVKKPVVLPFLDYHARPERKRFCQEEVRLNRRLAPNIYRGVRSLAMTTTGFALSSPDDPRTIEYAVEMRRFAPGDTLRARLAAGSVTTGDLEAVALRLARFHSDAPRALSRAPFSVQLTSALDALVDASGKPIVHRLRSAILRLHERCAAELEERKRRGLIRDGHGDLRAEHILLGDEIQIYDCVEFDSALRQIDVGCDLAFLVMDLERLGHAEDAAALLELYRRAGGDPGSGELQQLFGAYRACVRALVALLRARQLEGSARRDEIAKADSLMRLAWRFVWRSHFPLVLAICGPAASGKTTLAEEIAEVSGLPRLNSDRVRKALAGLRPDERGDSSLYAQHVTNAVYLVLGREAKAAPGGALVDATFRHVNYREIFREAVAPVEPVFVECFTPRNVFEARARRREREPLRESDADAARALAQLTEFEPLAELPRRSWFSINTAGPVDLLAAAVEAKLPTAAAAADPEADAVRLRSR